MKAKTLNEKCPKCGGLIVSTKRYVKCVNFRKTKTRETATGCNFILWRSDIGLTDRVAEALIAGATPKILLIEYNRNRNRLRPLWFTAILPRPQEPRLQEGEQS